MIKDGNTIIKKYKHLSNNQNIRLMGKLERISDVKKINGLTVPYGYNVKNGFVQETYTKYIDYDDLSYNTDNGKLSFESISKCISNLECILKKLHDNDICALDFSSSGNLKYNSKTNEVCLLDYEDMQVGPNFAFACNTSLRDFLDLSCDKYYASGKFTYNADIYLLAIFWFKMCTSLQLSNMLKKPYDLLDKVNLSINEEIAKKILLCYDLDSENQYFGEELLKIYDHYNLSDNKYSTLRKFIRK